MRVFWQIIEHFWQEVPEMGDERSCFRHTERERERVFGRLTTKISMERLSHYKTEVFLWTILVMDCLGARIEL